MTSKLILAAAMVVASCATVAFELARQLDLIGHLESYELPWVAQVYKDMRDDKALRSSVSALLRASEFDVYRPTHAHHWVARLPFKRMINTSLDYLLEDALERQGVPVDACLPQGFQSYLSGRQRVLVRLYGTPREPDTLRLTEDERRCVLPTGSESTVAGMLRSEALGPNTLLFIGSDPGDPCFRQMFYDLRGQTSVLRRAYIVLSQSDPEECRYCEGHGLVPVTNTDLSDFLERLASELKRVGIDVLSEIGWERSREETDDDFESRAWVAAREYARKSLTGGGVAESSSQLKASLVFGSFLRKALSEKGGRQTPETLLLKAREQWSEGDRDGARESFEKAIAGMGRATESDQGYQLLLDQACQDLYHLLVEMGQGQEAAEKYPDIVSRIMPDQYRYREILGPTRVGIAYRVSYRVSDRDDQPKTLTLLYRTVGREPGDLDDFVGEVRKVDSGRIRPAKDVLPYGGRAYLVSDDADGKPLRVYLAKLRQELPPRRPVFEITDQIAEALTVAHAHQLPHLDLSPDNVMLDAREQDQGVILGASGAVLVNYRFSELATRKGGVRTRPSKQDLEEQKQQDIQALGSVLEEMWPDRSAGGVDEAVDIVVDRSRSREPSRRFPNIGDMRQEMQRIAVASGAMPWRVGPSQEAKHARAGRVFLRLLARISSARDWLAARWRWTMLPFLAAVAVVELLGVVLFGSGAPEGFQALQTLTRLALIAAINTTAIGAISRSVLREVARRHGLGSLVLSGWGMGAVLGFILTIWWFAGTGWPADPATQITSPFYLALGQISIPNAVAYMALQLAVVLLSFVAIYALMLGCSAITRRRNLGYLTGLYVCWVVLCVLLLASLPVGLGSGILQW